MDILRLTSMISRFDLPEPQIQILVVDHNRNDVGILQQIFTQRICQHWQMIQVESLADAICTCKEYIAMTHGKQTFDVALLELSLPDSSGIDTVKHFHEEVPSR